MISALLRRKLLEEIYNDLSEDDKRAFVMMTMQNKGYKDIMQALQGQSRKLDDIERKQSWYYDLSANIAGSAILDSATWLFGKLIKL